MRRIGSRPIARLLIAAVSVVLSAIAFVRGNDLFGLGYGVLYATVTLGLVWFFARSLTPIGNLSLVRVAAVTALSLAIGFVMAWPALVNPDVQYFIDEQALDRGARSELAAVFASDPAYRDLSASSVHLKVVNITVQGSLGAPSDLDRLRSRIAGECSTLGACVLHWDVTLRDSGQRVSGLDRDLFPARKQGAEHVSDENKGNASNHR